MIIETEDGAEVVFRGGRVLYRPPPTPGQVLGRLRSQVREYAQVVRSGIKLCELNGWSNTNDINALQADITRLHDAVKELNSV